MNVLAFTRFYSKKTYHESDKLTLRKNAMSFEKTTVSSGITIAQNNSNESQGILTLPNPSQQGRDDPQTKVTGVVDYQNCTEGPNYLEDAVRTCAYVTDQISYE